MFHLAAISSQAERVILVINRQEKVQEHDKNGN